MAGSHSFSRIVSMRVASKGPAIACEYPADAGDQQRPRPCQQQRLIVDDVCRRADRLTDERDTEHGKQHSDLSGEQIIEYRIGLLVTRSRRQPERQRHQAGQKRQQRKCRRRIVDAHEGVGQRSHDEM